MNNDKKIVVVGSLHYDIVVESPHRPEKGETVLGIRWFPKFGGKGGNQALAAAQAGCNVTMVSAIGEDEFGKFIFAKLKEHNINTNFIQKKSVSSGMSVAIMDDEGDYGAVVVSGANLAIEESKLAEGNLWDDAKILILQNEVTEKINICAAKQANLRQIPVCINAAPARLLSTELIQLIDILIVNSIEARDMSNIEVNDLESALCAALKLSKTYKQVIVTAGGAGVAYANQSEQGIVPAIKVELVSTHGAGDCFVGYLCASLIQGNSLKSAVEYANLKAAQHVSGKL
ncbi:MAG TPA: ribokinase [Pasteurellaceae bacterium]|nr:ribokinase [Pasteurellaceae bacterium]